ncbi:ImmA/IrrE family metallo-endopeptidase [Leptospira wolffii]|uniref:ImmA/IrrE family metallo-endopeptidase n=1 Tax=Leptospira wolffii TaxID=409998 RepID=UPI0010848D19|nr:ImmA/IrrE family metallo-endopeptidase [Leptospira wolffii]TGL50812.1 ImmA/IrrE family metallo-endopeptidase [Leptospira wolffii]
MIHTFKDKENQSREAYKRAFRFRQANKIPLTYPLNAIDLAEKSGLEVRLQNLPSTEGLYYRGSENATIILSNLRPSGRINFSCAHELGHHVFGHGNSIHEFFEHHTKFEKNTEEYLADFFAGHLLMPEVAIRDAFKNFSYSKKLNSKEAYILSTFFRVGYSTLINHLYFSQKLLSKLNAESLLRESPQNIKSEILQAKCSDNLIVFSESFGNLPIDLRTKDIIFLPDHLTVDGKNVEFLKKNANGNFFISIKPGLSRILSKTSDFATYLRIAKFDFEGRARYRHLEEE